MSSHAADDAYADDAAAEDSTLLTARDEAAGLGVACVAPATGALLTVLAAAARARTVVEIGTGVGVSGVYLLRGMDQAGVLTSIDVEPEHHRTARAVLADAGFGPERTRLITGRALDVLPRLTDGGYDLVFIDGRRSEFPAYLEQATRLIRPGGLLVVARALGNGKTADPAQRDADTTAVRETVRAMRIAEDLGLALVPVNDGLAVAVNIPTAEQLA